MAGKLKGIAVQYVCAKSLRSCVVAHSVGLAAGLSVCGFLPCGWNAELAHSRLQLRIPPTLRSPHYRTLGEGQSP
jgi:hypothetical protein